MKNKLNKVKLDKRKILLVHEYEDNSLQYHFHNYNENKYPSNRNGYLAYKKLKRQNTKIRKLSDNLKDTYGITVGTNLPQFAEPPNPIVKWENFNRIPIKNCTSVYQMKIFTVSSAFIISRRPFALINVYISSDPIYYLLCNKCEVHLNDEDTDKENGLQFIWTDFYWSIISCKDTRNQYHSEFIWNFFLWNVVNGGLMRLYSNFRLITTVFQLQIHNQYLWVELKT